SKSCGATSGTKRSIRKNRATSASSSRPMTTTNRPTTTVRNDLPMNAIEFQRPSRRRASLRKAPTMSARSWCAAVLALGVAAGCGGTSTAHHPLTNDLSPAYANLSLHTMAALPFGSDISDDEDPDKVAGSMTESKFYTGLSSGSGFTILPSAEVQRMLDREGLTPQLKKFYKEWISDQGSADA